MYISGGGTRPMSSLAKITIRLVGLVSWVVGGYRAMKRGSSPPLSIRDR